MNLLDVSEGGSGWQMAQPGSLIHAFRGSVNGARQFSARQSALSFRIASDMNATPSWLTALYDDAMAALILADVAPADVDFLCAQLGLGAGSRVFDQCCGPGSVARWLIRRGAWVTGVDQSAAYVAAAAAAARELGQPDGFHVGDAAAFVPAVPCDAALSWRTSLGYADDPACDRRMVQRAFAALRPGGRFALDYQNVPFLLRGFQRALVRRGATAAGEVLLLRESEILLTEGRLRQRWTYLYPGGEQRTRESAVRLYLPHELLGLLRDSGFVDLELFGGTEGRGQPLTLDSPRCICVGRRP